MIYFWTNHRNRNYLQLTAGLVAISFLFTTVSAPFANARLFGAAKEQHPLSKTFETYAQNLEKLKIEDKTSRKQISNLVDALKNRLSFVGPVKKNGKSYLFGSYRGDQARINFILQVSPVEEIKGTVFKGSEAREAIDTLRDMPGSFLGVTQGTQRDPKHLPFFKILRAFLFEQGQRVVEMHADREARRFALEQSPFEVGEEEVSKEGILNLWGKHFGIDPRIQDRRLYFTRKERSILTHRSKPRLGKSRRESARPPEESRKRTRALSNHSVRGLRRTNVKRFVLSVLKAPLFILGVVGMGSSGGSSGSGGEIGEPLAETEEWEVIGEMGTGPGEFDNPVGIAFDPEGNLWVTDANNNRLQMRDNNTGNWHVVGEEGTKPGQFNDPQGIVFDSDGNLWVADKGNSRLQRRDKDTGDWTVTGEGVFIEPVQVNILKGDIYVVDIAQSCFKKMNKDTGKWIDDESFGNPNGEGAVDARDYIRGDARDSEGKYWEVSRDHSLQVTKRDRATGKMTVLKVGRFGTGPGEFHNLRYIAFDTEGNLWVADSGNHRLQVRKVSKEAALTPFQTPSGSSFPAPELKGEDSTKGAVVLSALDKERLIAELKEMAAEVEALLAKSEITPEDLARAQELAELSDAKVQSIAGLEPSQVRDAGEESDSQTGNVFLTLEWTVVGGRKPDNTYRDNTYFGRPKDIAFDSEGNPWVTERNTLQMRNKNTGKWIRLGTFKKGRKKGEFKDPEGIAFDPDGNLWVADTYNHRIQRRDKNTGEWTVIGRKGVRKGEFYLPSGIVFDPEGNLWVADTGNNRLQKRDKNTGKWTVVEMESVEYGGFGKPCVIAFDTEGNLWVLDTLNHRIVVRSKSTGVWMAIGKEGTGPGKFRYPKGMAFDPEGNLWVADTDNQRIQMRNKNTGEWTMTGEASQYAPEEIKKVLEDHTCSWSPHGIAFDADGYLWVADNSNEVLEVSKNPIKSAQSQLSPIKDFEEYKFYKEFHFQTGIVYDEAGIKRIKAFEVRTGMYYDPQTGKTTTDGVVHTTWQGDDISLSGIVFTRNLSGSITLGSVVAALLISPYLLILTPIFYGIFYGATWWSKQFARMSSSGLSPPRVSEQESSFSALEQIALLNRIEQLFPKFKFIPADLPSLSPAAAQDKRIIVDLKQISDIIAGKSLKEQEFMLRSIIQHHEALHLRGLPHLVIYPYQMLMTALRLSNFPHIIVYPYQMILTSFNHSLRELRKIIAGLEPLKVGNRKLRKINVKRFTLSVLKAPLFILGVVGMGAGSGGLFGGTGTTDPKSGFIGDKSQIRNSVITYYQARKGLIEAIRNSDARSYKEHYENLLSSAKFVKSSIAQDQLQPLIEELKKSGSLSGLTLQNHKGEYSIGPWDEILHAAGEEFSAHHKQWIEETLDELIQAFPQKQRRHILPIRQKALDQTFPYSSEYSISYPDEIAQFIENTKDPMELEIMARWMESNLAMASYFEEAGNYGLTFINLHSRIILHATENEALFRSTYAHELIHYLAHEGKLDIPSNVEIVTHAIGAVYIASDKKVGESAQDWAAITPELDKFYLFFESGKKWAKDQGFKTVEEIGFEQMMQITHETVVENWEELGLPSLEFALHLPLAMELGMFDPEFFQRWAGTALGGAIWEISGAIPEESKKLAVELILGWADKVLATITQEIPKFAADPERRKNILAAITSNLQILTENPDFKLVPSPAESGRQMFAISQDRSQIEYVPEMLDHPDPEVTEALFYEQVFSVLYSNPGWVEPEFKNSYFLALFAAAELIRTRKMGEEKLRNILEKFQKLNKALYSNPESESAKQRMNQLPLFVQYLEALLFEGRTGQRDPRISNKDVRNALRKTVRARRSIKGIKEERDAYRIIRDEIWPKLKELAEKSEEEMREKELKKQAGAGEGSSGQGEGSSGEGGGGQSGSAGKAGAGGSQKGSTGKAGSKAGSSGEGGRGSQAGSASSENDSGNGDAMEDLWNKMDADDKRQFMEQIKEKVRKALEDLLQGMGSNANSQAAKETSQEEGKADSLNSMESSANSCGEKIDQMKSDLNDMGEMVEGAKQRAESMEREAGKMRDKTGISPITEHDINKLKEMISQVKEKAQKLKEESGSLKSQSDKLSKNSKNMDEGISSSAEDLKSSAKNLQEKTGDLKENANNFDGKVNEIERKLEEISKAPEGTPQPRTGAAQVQEGAGDLQDKAKEMLDLLNQLKDLLGDASKNLENVKTEIEQAKEQNGQGKKGKQGKAPETKPSEDSATDTPSTSSASPSLSDLARDLLNKLREKITGASNPTRKSAEEITDLSKEIKSAGMTQAESIEMNQMFTTTIRAEAETLHLKLRKNLQETELDKDMGGLTEGDLDEDNLVEYRLGKAFKRPLLPGRVKHRVMFLFDNSGSMGSMDDPNSSIYHAARAAMVFLLAHKGLKGVEVGVWIYGNTPSQQLLPLMRAEQITELMIYRMVKKISESHGSTEDINSMKELAKFISEGADANTLLTVLHYGDGNPNDSALQPKVQKFYLEHKDKKILWASWGTGPKTQYSDPEKMKRDYEPTEEVRKAVHPGFVPISGYIKNSAELSVITADFVERIYRKKRPLMALAIGKIEEIVEDALRIVPQIFKDYLHTLSDVVERFIAILTGEEDEYILSEEEAAPYQNMISEIENGVEFAVRGIVGSSIDIEVEIKITKSPFAIHLDKGAFAYTEIHKHKDKILVNFVVHEAFLKAVGNRSPPSDNMLTLLAEKEIKEELFIKQVQMAHSHKDFSSLKQEHSQLTDKDIVFLTDQPDQAYLIFHKIFAKEYASLFSIARKIIQDQTIRRFVEKDGKIFFQLKTPEMLDSVEVPIYSEDEGGEESKRVVKLYIKEKGKWVRMIPGENVVDIPELIAYSIQQKGKEKLKTFKFNHSNTKTLADMFQIYTNPNAKNSNLGLVGPRGSGKNTLGYILAGLVGIPQRLMSLHAHTNQKDLRERKIISSSEQIIKVAIPGTDQVFELALPSDKVDVLLSEAFEAARLNQLAIIDEADKVILPGHLSGLNALFNRIQEKIEGFDQIGNDFRAMVYINTPEGGDVLGQDLTISAADFVDRVKWVFVDYMDPESELDYVMSTVFEDASESEKELAEPFVQSVILVANRIRTAVKQRKLSRVLSTRGVIRIAKHFRTFPNDLQYFRSMFEKAYCSETAEGDKSLIDTFIKETFGEEFNKKVPLGLKLGTFEYLIENGKVYVALGKGTDQVKILTSIKPENVDKVKEELKDEWHIPSNMVLFWQWMKDISLGNNIIVLGVPGTGKSELASYLLNHVLRLDSNYMVLTTDSRGDDILGSWNIINNIFHFKRSPLPVSMEAGVPVIIDEIDKPKDETTLSSLNNIGEFGQIILPDRSLVDSQPGFFSFMIGNLAGKGGTSSQRISGEVLDRGSVYIMDQLPPKDMVEMLRRYSVKHKYKIEEKFLEALVNFHLKLAEKVKLNQLLREPTMRALENVIDQVGRFPEKYYDIGSLYLQGYLLSSETHRNVVREAVWEGIKKFGNAGLYLWIRAIIESYSSGLKEETVSELADNLIKFKIRLEQEWKNGNLPHAMEQNQWKAAIEEIARQNGKVIWTGNSDPSLRSDSIVDFVVEELGLEPGHRETLLKIAQHIFLEFNAQKELEKRLAEIKANLTKIGQIPSRVGNAGEKSGSQTGADVEVGEWSTVGMEGKNPGEFYFPYSVTFDPEGNLWVSDKDNHRIQMKDKNTGVWSVVGRKGTNLGEFDEPHVIAFDPEGNLWVADKNNHRLQMKNKNTGEWIVIGNEGINLGEFKDPWAIAFDHKGNLWVAEKNGRLQVRNKDTGVWSILGKEGFQLGEFKFPSSIAFDSEDNLWVVDGGNKRLQMRNKITGEWISIHKIGSRPGEFQFPSSIAFDLEGNLWVADSDNNYLQMRNNITGEWIVLGKQGTEPGEFNFPYGIGFDSEGNLWVADKNNHRLQMRKNPNKAFQSPSIPSQPHPISLSGIVFTRNLSGSITLGTVIAALLISPYLLILTPIFYGIFYGATWWSKEFESMSSSGLSPPSAGEQEVLLQRKSPSSALEKEALKSSPRTLEQNALLSRIEQLFPKFKFISADLPSLSPAAAQDKTIIVDLKQISHLLAGKSPKEQEFMLRSIIQHHEALHLAGLPHIIIYPYQMMLTSINHSLRVLRKINVKRFTLSVLKSPLFILGVVGMGSGGGSSSSGEIGKTDRLSLGKIIEVIEFGKKDDHGQDITFRRSISASGVVTPAHSPDGLLTAIAVGNNVRIEDNKTGEIYRILNGHTSNVTAISYSPDGSKIASSDEEGNTYLWDTLTWSPSLNSAAKPIIIEGKSVPVWANTFSPDGTMLLTGGVDRTVEFWDTETGEAITDINGNPVMIQVLDMVIEIRFSADGERIAIDSGNFIDFRYFPVFKIVRENGLLIPSSSPEVQTTQPLKGGEGSTKGYVVLSASDKQKLTEELEQMATEVEALLAKPEITAEDLERAKVLAELSDTRLKEIEIAGLESLQVGDAGEKSGSQTGADVEVGEWSVEGNEGTAPGEFNNPHNIAFDSDGNLWVAEFGNHRLQRMDKDTGAWSVIGKEGIEPDEFKDPRSIAFDSEGNLWVADWTNNRLQMMDKDTKEWSVMGKKGTEPGEFDRPIGIAFDSDGNMWVADSGNHRLQRMDKDTGKWSVVGEHGTVAMLRGLLNSSPGEFNYPRNIAFDSEGNLWVVEWGNHRLQRMDKDTGAWSVIGKEGIEPGEFKRPHGIAFDSEGNLWVADYFNHRLQRMDKDTKEWSVEGKFGTEPGEFNHPTGIVFDSEGNLWVAEFGNHRLQVHRNPGQLVQSPSDPSQTHPISLSGIVFTRNLSGTITLGSVVAALLISPYLLILTPIFYGIFYGASWWSKEFESMSSSGLSPPSAGEQEVLLQRKSPSSALEKEALKSSPRTLEQNALLSRIEQLFPKFKFISADLPSLSPARAEGKTIIVDLKQISYLLADKSFKEQKFMLHSIIQHHEALHLAGLPHIIIYPYQMLMTALRLSNFPHIIIYPYQMILTSFNHSLREVRKIIAGLEPLKVGNRKLRKINVKRFTLSVLKAPLFILGVVGMGSGGGSSSSGEIGKTDRPSSGKIIEVIELGKKDDHGQDITFRRSISASGVVTPAHSPDGLLTAIADGTNVRIEDSKTGEIYRILNGHRSNVTAISYSPDGSKIASSDEEGNTYLWHTLTWSPSLNSAGKPIIIEGKSVPVWANTFSPDGTMLLTGGVDRTVEFWDTETGEAITDINGNPVMIQVLDMVIEIRFSADGERIAIDSGNFIDFRYFPVFKIVRENGLLIPSSSPEVQTTQPLKGGEGSTKGDVVLSASDKQRLTEELKQMAAEVEALLAKPVITAEDLERAKVLAELSDARVQSIAGLESLQVGDAGEKSGSQTGDADGEQSGSQTEYVVMVGEWSVVGKLGTGLGEFTYPQGIAFDPKGNLWVADTYNHRLQMKDKDTGVWSMVGRKGGKKGEFKNPRNIAFDSEGNLWVADTNNHRLQMKDKNTGEWIAVGMEGIEQGEFDSPHGIAFDPKGNLWVADGNNHRLQMRDKNTGVWSVVGQKGIELGEFKSPDNIAFDPEGNLWVADTYNHRIQRRDKNTGNWIAVGKYGTVPGEFISPRSVTFDLDGNLWVCDNGNHRLQMRDKETGEWSVMGKKGTKMGEFKYPRNIAFDSEWNLWVDDSENQRLQVCMWVDDSENQRLQVCKNLKEDSHVEPIKDFKEYKRIREHHSQWDIGYDEKGIKRIKEFEARTGMYYDPYTGETTTDGVARTTWQGDDISLSGIVFTRNLSGSITLGSVVAALMISPYLLILTPIFYGIFYGASWWIKQFVRMSSSGRSPPSDRGQEVLLNRIQQIFPKYHFISADLPSLSPARAEGKTIIVDLKQISYLLADKSFKEQKFMVRSIIEHHEALHLAGLPHFIIYPYQMILTSIYHSLPALKIPLFIWGVDGMGSGSGSSSGSGTNRPDPSYPSSGSESSALEGADQSLGSQSQTSAGDDRLSSAPELKGEGSSKGDVVLSASDKQRLTEELEQMQAEVEALLAKPEITAEDLARAKVLAELSDARVQSIAGLAGIEPLQVGDAGEESGSQTGDADMVGEWSVIGKKGREEPGEFNRPTSIAFDSEGNLWVADTGDYHGLQRMDKDTAAWSGVGEQGTEEPGKLHVPHGIAFDSEGNLWVADAYDHRLQMMDKDTGEWSVVGKQGTGLGEFKYPRNIAFDSKGNLWVADTNNHRLQMKDKNTGEWIAVGMEGIEPGEFDSPHGIAFDSKGNLWVADGKNNRLQMMDIDTGEWSVVGKQGTGLGEFKNPEGIAFDSEWNLWVADAYNHRLQRMDKDTRAWSVIGEEGTEPGAFNQPYGIAFDSEGNLWVAEFGNHRLQVHRNPGQLVQSPSDPSQTHPISLSGIVFTRNLSGSITLGSVVAALMISPYLLILTPIFYGIFYGATWWSKEFRRMNSAGLSPPSYIEQKVLLQRKSLPSASEYGVLKSQSISIQQETLLQQEFSFSVLEQNALLSRIQQLFPKFTFISADLPLLSPAAAQDKTIIVDLKQISYLIAGKSLKEQDFMLRSIIQHHEALHLAGLPHLVIYLYQMLMTTLHLGNFLHLIIYPYKMLITALHNSAKSFSSIAYFVYEAVLILPGISKILKVFAEHEKAEWTDLIKDDQKEAINSLESSQADQVRLRSSWLSLPALPLSSTLVSMNLSSLNNGMVLASVHPGLLASASGIGSGSIGSQLSGDFLSLRFGLASSLSYFINGEVISASQLGQIAFHPMEAVETARGFISNSIFSIQNGAPVITENEGEVETVIHKIEEILEQDRQDEAEIYPAIVEKSSKQNIRLLMNTGNLAEESVELRKLIEGIEKESEHIKDLAGKGESEKNGSEEGTNRQLQILIVTDPNIMGEEEAKEVLRKNEISSSQIDSYIKFIHQPMGEQGYSFQKVITDNEWIMEGDYSLWVLNNHRWADLVGELLNSFLIKNRIELLELDLKITFATETSQ